MSIGKGFIPRYVLARIRVGAAAVATGLLVANCSTMGSMPNDTGSMATPQPMAPGFLSTTGAGMPPQQRDTGNMAYPQPLPQGDISTTRVR